MYAATPDSAPMRTARTGTAHQSTSMVATHQPTPNTANRPNATDKRRACALSMRTSSTTDGTAASASLS